MIEDNTPATVVILARLDAATTAESFGPLAERVRRAAAPVTWVADSGTLRRLAGEGSDWGWGLALDVEAVESRQTLRRDLATIREIGVDAVVVNDGRPIAHRDLLVASGIHTAVVDRFDDVPRGPRRPAPEGWACRSIVWGLWEVETGPARSPGLLGRLIPWRVGPPAGSLTIVEVGRGMASPVTADRVVRSIADFRTGRRPPRFARLGDLPTLLASGCQTTGGSVLRAA